MNGQTSRKLTSRAPAALCFLVLALLTACSSRGNSSDDERRGGFYGGMTGGMSRP